ncbi:MAG TPA: DUF2085 domain-containing protein [Pyrinomonadaceae bacterium]|nr:DUF2085 domain-containing protein [Pyrinomonadaceae bacterium]
MKQTIKNYIPQIANERIRRRAFAVWSVSALIIFGWVLLIPLAPFAEARNLTSISNPLYNFFGYVCHQSPARSFHLENHAFAVCSRCFGIYFGLLAGFAAYPFFRSAENVEPLPRFWLFGAMIPMAIDWTLGALGIWENTHLSRFLSGLILGAACAVFLIPALIEFFRLFYDKRRTKKSTR